MEKSNSIGLRGTETNQEQGITAKVNPGSQTLGTGYRKYEVDLRGCNLNIGEPIAPETVIGCHHRTGEPVTAGLHGRVATIYFNPAHDSLMIMAVSKSN
jgi:hypothetical protein